LVTKKRWKWSLAFAKEWAGRLRLSEWLITLQHMDMAETTLGQAQSVPESMSAVIALSSALLERQEDKDIQGTIIHELLHIVLTPLRNAAYNRYATEDMIDTAEERAVLRLERAFLEMI